MLQLMGRMRGVGVAGLAVLAALPAIALAAVKKPPAGNWKVTVAGPSKHPKGSFKITSDRKHIKSFKLPLLSSEGVQYGATCPTGTLTVPATLQLKKYGGFWAYGKGVPGSPGSATLRNVSAKLNGAPHANVSLLIQLSESQDTKIGSGELSIGKPGTPGCTYDLSFKH
jgi:hypothetical protein